MRTRILEDPDKLRNDFCIHPLKFICSAATCAACLMLGIPFLMIGEPLGTVLMAGIFAIFAWQAWLFGPFVSISADGIRKHIFGWTLQEQRWEDISEVGVIGTKVFNRLHPEKTGYLYLYFSTEKLDDDKRFRMALEFPPKNRIYLLHNKEREDLIQSFWSTRIVGYNVGNLNLKKDPDPQTVRESSETQQP